MVSIFKVVLFLFLLQTLVVIDGLTMRKVYITHVVRTMLEYIGPQAFLRRDSSGLN
jgi:hypothetical protein